MPDPIQTLQPLPQTPADYITPDALEQMRKYSQAMLGGSGQQPVHHWTQGVSNMVNALLGGDMAYRANQREIASQQYRLSQNPEAAGTLGNPTPDGSPKPVSQGDQPSAQPASFASRFNSAFPSVMQVADTGGGGGTRGSVFGNFQGKYNWVDKSDRGNQASGVPVQAGPGIALPTRRTLGQLFDVTTPDGRTFTVKQTDTGPAAWTGRGVDINAALAEQMGYNPKNFPTDARFTVRPHQGGVQQASAQPISWQPNQFSFNQPQPPQAPGDPGGAGYNGPSYEAMQQQPSAQPAAPAAAPMQVAGGPRPGVPGPAGVGQPAPVGAAPNPGLIGMRPQVSRGQYIQSQLPGAEPWRQQMVTDMYYQQHMPLSFPGMGGNYVVSPDGKNIGFVPDIQHMDVTAGPGKANVPYHFDAQGNVVFPQGLGNIFGGGAGGKSELEQTTPTAPPAPPSTPAPSPSATPAAPSSGPTSPATPISLTQGGAASPQAPYSKVGAGRGTLYLPNAPAPGTKAADTGGTRVAQADGGLSGLMQGLGTLGAQQDMKSEEAKAAAKGIGEDYDTTMTQAKAAQNTLVNDIPIMKRALNDDSIWTGFAGDIVAQLKKMAAIGNPNAAAATEIFKKAASSLTVDQLKQRLGGLGQIRLAELYLINQSNPNLDNSLAANRFLVEANERVAKRAQEMGRLTNDYVAHHGFPDAKWRALMLQHFDGEKNPLFTDKELANWEQYMRQDPSFKWSGQKTPAPAPKGPPPPRPPGFE